MAFVLEIPVLPPSVNHRARSWREMHHLTDEFKRQLYAVAYERGMTDNPIGSKGMPLRVDIGYLYGTEKGIRSSDTMSNREKPVLDALQDAGLITNDRYVKQGTVASALAPRSSVLIRVSHVPLLTEEELRRRFE